MSSPFATVLNNLSGAVAFVSQPSRQVASEWADTAGLLHDLYTDLRIYKALLQLRASDPAFTSGDSPPFKHFGDALSACNHAVRPIVSQLPSAHFSYTQNSSATPLDPPHGNQGDRAIATELLVEQRTKLGHSFVLMWVDSLPGPSLVHAATTPLPASPLHAGPSTVQSDLQPLKLSRGLFNPPFTPTITDPLDAFLNTARNTAEGAGKQWAARMGIEVEDTSTPFLLPALVLGSIFCVVLDAENSLPPWFAESIASLRSLLCHALIGMAEEVASIAFLGSVGSGKSLLIDCLMGSLLFTPGSTTTIPCRIQHVPGLSDPVLHITPGPFTLAVEKLQRLKFTARCDEWGADRQNFTLHRSEADASFKELWEAWLTLDSHTRPLIETIDQLGLTFQPITTGTRAVRETLLRLEGVAQLCRAFEVPVSFDGIEWPVLQVEFKPFKDRQFTQPCEVLNLPGMYFDPTPNQLSLVNHLAQRGSTIVPVMNMAEQLSDPKWRRFPRMLNEKRIQVPCVIGPFLDITRHDDPGGEYFARQIAEDMWVGDAETSEKEQSPLQNRVLPCSLEEGFSAAHILDEFFTGPREAKPSLHTAWADERDPSFERIRYMFELTDEHKYHATPIAKLEENLRIFLSNSKLDVVIASVGQIAAESPVERRTKQLKCIQGQLRQIGNGLNILLTQASNMSPLSPGSSVGRPVLDVASSITLDCINDLRTRTRSTVDTALRNAFDELRKKWSEGQSKHSRVPAFPEDSAEYIIPMPALNSFLEVSTSQLKSALPTLLPAWIEEVVGLAASRLETKSKILDPASLVNECSGSTALLQESSVSDQEFITFKGRGSIDPSGDPEDPQVYTNAGRMSNPFGPLAQLIWTFLCRLRRLLSPRPIEYHIPRERARAVYMRVLGEPWLLDVERAVLTSLILAFRQMGFVEGFHVWDSITVALAALQDIPDQS